MHTTTTSVTGIAATTVAVTAAAASMQQQGTTTAAVEPDHQSTHMTVGDRRSADGAKEGAAADQHKHINQDEGITIYYQHFVLEIIEFSKTIRH